MIRSVSLLVVAAILLTSIVLSVTAARHEDHRGQGKKPADS